MKVVLSSRAQEDLSEIVAYIARDSPRAALAMSSRLRQAAKSLSSLAMRFAIDPATDMRKRSVGAYALLYVVGDRVEIVRILHAARDWPSELGEP
jgi:toxin ParE1/3/4